MRKSADKEAARIKAEFIARLDNYVDPATHGIQLKHDDYCSDLIEELDEINPLEALLMLWRERHAFEMQLDNTVHLWAQAADELESTLRDRSAI